MRRFRFRVAGEVGEARPMTTRAAIAAAKRKLARRPRLSRVEIESCGRVGCELIGSVYRDRGQVVFSHI